MSRTIIIEARRKNLIAKFRVESCDLLVRTFSDICTKK